MDKKRDWWTSLNKIEGSKSSACKEDYTIDNVRTPVDQLCEKLKDYYVTSNISPSTPGDLCTDNKNSLQPVSRVR